MIFGTFPDLDNPSPGFLTLVDPLYGQLQPVTPHTAI